MITKDVQDKMVIVGHYLTVNRDILANVNLMLLLYSALKDLLSGRKIEHLDSLIYLLGKCKEEVK